MASSVASAQSYTPGHGCNNWWDQARWGCAYWDHNNGPKFPYYGVLPKPAAPAKPVAGNNPALGNNGKLIGNAGGALVGNAGGTLIPSDSAGKPGSR